MFAGSGECEGLASAVSAAGFAFEQIQVDERGDDLRDGGARDACPAGDRAQREVLGECVFRRGDLRLFVGRVRGAAMVAVIER